MNDYRSLSDSELAILLNKEDKAALEEIYLRYWPVLYQHARKLLRDDTKAEDAVHDLFANLLANMGRLNTSMPLAPYLYRSIRNHVINSFHKDASRQKYEESMRSYYNQGNFETDETILENELQKRIESAIADLPTKMRVIFELSRVENLSHQEIAKAVNKSVNTVKTQIQRALKLMRSKLSSLFL